MQPEQNPASPCIPMWTVSSILFNGVSGVGIPNANVVELWLNGALVLGALAFFPPEFRVMVFIGGCRRSFSFCFGGSLTRKDAFGGILDARWWDGKWKSQRCVSGSAKNHTFLFGIFYFLQTVGDARGSTFDHSARIRPAIPSLQVLISWFSTTPYKDLSQV